MMKSSPPSGRSDNQRQKKARPKSSGEVAPDYDVFPRPTNDVQRHDTKGKTSGENVHTALNVFYGETLGSDEQSQPDVRPKLSRQVTPDHGARTCDETR